MAFITILGFIVASLAGTTYAEDYSIDYLDSAFQDVDIAETKRYRMAHALLAAHPLIGLVLLAALFLQPSLGYLHRLRFKHLQRRTWISRVHTWLGRASVVLGVINGVLGITFSTPSVEVYFIYLMLGILTLLGWFTYYHCSKDEKETKKKKQAAAQQAAERHAAAVAAAIALLERQPPPPPPQQQQQQPSVPPQQAVTEPDRPLLRAERSLRRYFRNWNAPYEDPAPPYSRRSVDGPPVYGDAVEMTPMDGSGQGRGCRAAASSESLERGDPDSW
ncbi:hypothetical protein Hte_001147 [Hypoxylon texense]